MKDLQLSIVCGHDRKYSIGLTAVFEESDDAISFNEKIIDLCKQALEAARAKIPTIEPAPETQRRDGEEVR